MSRRDCFVRVIFLSLLAAALTRAPLAFGRVGSDSAAPPSDLNSFNRDDLISAGVRLALFADPDLARYDIRIRCQDGVVRLTGAVPSDEAREAAGLTAFLADGVVTIENQIGVDPATERPAVKPDDGAINRQLDQLAEIDPDLLRLGLGTRSESGIVVLTGTVLDRLDLLRAAVPIRNLPGVRAVKTSAVEIRRVRLPTQVIQGAPPIVVKGPPPDPREWGTLKDPVNPDYAIYPEFRLPGESFRPGRSFAVPGDGQRVK